MLVDGESLIQIIAPSTAAAAPASNALIVSAKDGDERDPRAVRCLLRWEPALAARSEVILLML